MILLLNFTIYLLTFHQAADHARILRKQVDNRDQKWHEDIQRSVRIAYVLHDFPLPCVARKDASELSDDDQYDEENGGDQVGNVEGDNDQMSDEEGDASLMQVKNAEVSDKK